MFLMWIGKHILQRVFAYGLGGLVLVLAPVCSNAQTVLGTQTLTLNLQPAGLLCTVPATVSLAHTGTTFSAFTGAVTLNYRARTTASSGGGTITVKATTDFTCSSGGPCIATPPSTGDMLNISLPLHSC
jgi:hypothetical protein